MAGRWPNATIQEGVRVLRLVSLTEVPPAARREDDEGSRPTEALQPPWSYRGSDLSRILALSDGIFAFAMTLLVLSLVLPAGLVGAAVGNYLLDPRFFQALYAYLITFFVLMLWWQGHHLVFGYIRLYDRNLIRLNMVFLVFIAILPFATAVLNAARDAPVGVVFFSLIQLGTGGTLGALWVYASGGGKLVAPTVPGAWKRQVTLSTFTPPIVFGASIPIAFVNSRVAEFFWLAIFVLWVVGRRRIREQSLPAAGM